MQQLDQVMQMSGDEVKRTRGMRVQGDTTLLSQAIANNPNIDQVLSSGTDAQRRRDKGTANMETGGSGSGGGKG